MVSGKNIGRLSLYRRILSYILVGGNENIYSHELARLASGTAAQVRRDVMAVGYTGSPTRGYDTKELIEAISHFLDAPDGQKVALIGIGNLGRALLAYFSGRWARLTIVAAFDSDKAKVGRVVHGCRCYSLDELDDVINREEVTIAVVAVPAAYAQDVTERLILTGVKGILNFAPVRLSVPKGIYVEDLDVSMSLEKVAYFAKTSGKR